MVLTLALAACSGASEHAPPRGPKGFAIARVGTASSLVTQSGSDLSVRCREPLMVWVAPGTWSTIAEPPAADGTSSSGVWLPPDQAESHFDLDDFKLAPPNDCGGEVDCGWIRLDLTAPDSAGTAAESSTAGTENSGANPSTSLVVAAYYSDQSVIRADVPVAFKSWTPGPWTLRISLLDSTNQPVLSEKTNQPLTSEFSVNLVPSESCDPTAQ